VARGADGGGREADDGVVMGGERGDDRADREAGAEQADVL
jgi:hypothetical protein